jgi:hypothetical protein
MPHKIFLALICWPFPILGLLFGLLSEGRPPLAAVTTFTSPPPFCSPGRVGSDCLPWRPTPPPAPTATPVRGGRPDLPADCQYIGYEYTAFLPLIQR